ncbi:hypothetical protein THH46_02645 [Pseudomonas sp. NA13]
MALRFNRFTNYRADVYSLGALNVAARDGVARSVLLENISGTLESAKDMSLRSDTLINRKDVFPPPMSWCRAPSVSNAMTAVVTTTTSTMWPRKPSKASCSKTRPAPC